MVCIPCILIPAFLWFYYRFMRPYMGPVVAKLEEWFAPLKAKWCPECSITGVCPIKPSKKSADGVIKDRSKPADQKITPSAPAEELGPGGIDSEETLEYVMETGTFGTDVGQLRRRAEGGELNNVDTPTLVKSAV